MRETKPNKVREGEKEIGAWGGIFSFYYYYYWYLQRDLRRKFGFIDETRTGQYKKTQRNY
jgi:hypothetical protein